MFSGFKFGVVNDISQIDCFYDSSLNIQRGLVFWRIVVMVRESEIG